MSTELSKGTSSNGVLSYDVLLGRGRSNDNHPGNQHFSSLVVSFAGQYNATTSRLIKGRVAREVVELVYSNGGRFLKRNEANDLWVEASKDEAQVKAAQAMRYQHRRKVKNVYRLGHGAAEQAFPHMTLQSIVPALLCDNGSANNGSHHAPPSHIQAGLLRRSNRISVTSASDLLFESTNDEANAPDNLNNQVNCLYREEPANTIATAPIINNIDEEEALWTLDFDMDKIDATFFL